MWKKTKFNQIAFTLKKNGPSKSSIPNDTDSARLTCEKCFAEFSVFAQWESHRNFCGDFADSQTCDTNDTIGERSSNHSSCSTAAVPPPAAIKAGYKCSTCSITFPTIQEFFEQESCVDKSKRRSGRNDSCLCPLCACGLPRFQLCGHLRSVHEETEIKCLVLPDHCKLCKPHQKIKSNVDLLAHLATWHPLAFVMKKMIAEERKTGTSEDCNSVLFEETKSSPSPVQAPHDCESVGGAAASSEIEKESKSQSVESEELCQICGCKVPSYKFRDHVVEVHCTTNKVPDADSEPGVERVPHAELQACINVNPTVSSKPPRKARKSITTKRKRQPSPNPTEHKTRSSVSPSAEDQIATNLISPHGVDSTVSQTQNVNQWDDCTAGESAEVGEGEDMPESEEETTASQCDHCGQEFSSKGKLAVHLARFACRIAVPIACPFCGIGVMNWQLFDHLHSYLHLVDMGEWTRLPVLRAAALLCGFQTVQSTDSPPSLNATCPKCSKNFPNEGFCSAHLYSVHTNVKMFQRLDLNSVAENCKYKHFPSSKEYTCKICAAVFNSEMVLDLHYNTYHSRNKKCGPVGFLLAASNSKANGGAFKEGWEPPSINDVRSQVYFDGIIKYTITTRLHSGLAMENNVQIHEAARQLSGLSRLSMNVSLVNSAEGNKQVDSKVIQRERTAADWYARTSNTKPHSPQKAKPPKTSSISEYWKGMSLRDQTVFEHPDYTSLTYPYSSARRNNAPQGKPRFARYYKSAQEKPLNYPFLCSSNTNYSLKVGDALLPPLPIPGVKVTAEKTNPNNIPTVRCTISSKFQAGGEMQPLRTQTPPPANTTINLTSPKGTGVTFGGGNRASTAAVSPESTLVRVNRNGKALYLRRLHPHVPKPH